MEVNICIYPEPEKPPDPNMRLRLRAGVAELVAELEQVVNRVGGLQLPALSVLLASAVS